MSFVEIFNHPISAALFLPLFEGTWDILQRMIAANVCGVLPQDFPAFFDWQEKTL
ncbi:hypothetical protein [Pseudodesulfovibrio sp.]|uniref:hypothetical protein n=1 Tax=unclassified Pseudodesulfovibrio TaxID=2661612 RepID=UPI003AFFE2C9